MASKPVLRNLLMNETKWNFIMALAVSAVAAGAYKFFVADRRRKTVEEFFKTYDAEKAQKRLEAAGMIEGYQKYLDEQDD